jgi:hypothetical protein
MSSGEARDDGLARAERFAPIESYGVIGDSKSIALVAGDGAIDWWAAPAMDSPPVFAAILDPRDGGCFTLEPAVPYRVSRRYLPGTNVLETTFSTHDGAVRVIDSLNQGTNGPLPWAELARDIRRLLSLWVAVAASRTSFVARPSGSSRRVSRVMTARVPVTAA